MALKVLDVQDLKDSGVFVKKVVVGSLSLKSIRLYR